MMIREICRKDFNAALRLVWSVFLQFEAPDYSDDGVEEFRKSIHDTTYLNQLQMYGAYEADTLIGVIAVRSGGSHIALFFVDAAHQRRGVGRALFEQALANASEGTLTVNASPFAVPVYSRLGFVKTDAEQVTNGLRYTPMSYEGIIK